MHFPLLTGAEAKAEAFLYRTQLCGNIFHAISKYNHLFSSYYISVFSVWKPKRFVYLSVPLNFEVFDKYSWVLGMLIHIEDSSPFGIYFSAATNDKISYQI